jgi:hypothetical protein
MAELLGVAFEAGRAALSELLKAAETENRFIALILVAGQA